MASAGPYASLHLAPDRQPHHHPTTLFLQAGCPSCRPTNSVKEKRISGEAYDINKQTIYIVPKSKIESRVHYMPEPAWGSITY